ncbi:MAG: sialidase family protein [Bacteroidia bacterium]
MKDRKISRQPGGWNQDVPGLYRCNGMPVTVCDLSEGPSRGTIYVCWSDHRKGKGNIDIWLSRSTDRGDSWSKPVRVNNDETRAAQFFPWLAIDQTTGYLYCVYYDRSDENSLETRVSLAWSTDGGLSFSNVNLSEAPFTPRASVFFGDYNNISAHNGKIAPIWTQMDKKGKNSVWTAIVTEEKLRNEGIKE